MLTTLLPPTSGTAVVAGFDIRQRPGRRAPPHRLRRPGHAAAATPSACATSCISQGAFYGMLGRRETRARADELIESLELGQRRRPRTCSQLSRRPEAPARHRARAHPRPAAAVPRRAVDRPRPAEPRQPLAAHPRPAPRPRHDDLPHDALPRRGRPARRARHGDGPRRASSPTTPRTRSRQSLAGDVITLGVRRRRRMPRRRARAHRRRASDGTASSRSPRPTATALLPPLDPRARRRRTSTSSRATHRQPTLDDVFLALTGRSLREEAATPARTRPRPARHPSPPIQAASRLTRRTAEGAPP